ncbi:MAG TPA: hypothetical protein VLV16_00885 [Gemmatimonadales bacterium]|nr:hypothetical protein [Gemmatimonadales bacterium]
MADLLLQPFVEALGEEFPITGTTRDQLRAAIRYAILAPSSHNSQPWVFRLFDEHLDLMADRSRRLPVVDPDDRELLISCGAALFNLRLALRHFGIAERVEVLPDPGNPDLLARVTVQGRAEPSEEDHELFEMLRKRHTDRSPFKSSPVPEPVLATLAADAAKEGAWLAVVRAESARHEVAELVARGDRVQMADAAFRQELASWMRPNGSHKRDGMPGYAHELGRLGAFTGPLIVRTFDVGKRRAAHDEALAQGSPVLAVLGTDHDRPVAWLAAGQALAHILVRARLAGVSASFLNQPIEVPNLRLPLQTLTARPGYPQLLLRLGYSTRARVRATPRRSLETTLSGEL